VGGPIGRHDVRPADDNGNRAPQDINAFVPWTMDEARLAAMRACAPRARTNTEGIDTS
jgi:hypothetical protein